MASFSSNALRDYALVKSPSTQISASTLLLDSPECIAIFDAYPKAKYHFLVLPRYPFPSMTCNIDHLHDLTSLLGAPKDIRKAVIEGMRSMAGEVAEMIRDEMMKTEGFTWGIDLGFHAIPSMRHLHLHVISSDRVAPAMKTKKHYNSFRTDLGFFVHLSDVEDWIESDSRITLPGDEVLKASLDCVACGQTLKTMPALKAHLVEEWEKSKKKALGK